MNVRSEVLKTRAIILLAGAMAMLAGSASGAWAAEKPQPVDSGWYFHGGLEAGGRGYIERPPSGFGYSPNGNFLLPTETDSRAKWEKYGEIPPGAFLDWISFDVGTNDGRYRYNFLGKDVGYNAQSYSLDFSEAGYQYLNLGWDQTPHLYSTSAKSLFSGVGSTTLTVSDGVQAALQAQLAAASANTGPGLTARQTINNIFNSNATHIDEIATRRDKFSAGYRITPTPDWDFNVDYSHEDRTGTLPKTLDYGYSAGPNSAGFPSNVVAVPIPIDETTQRPSGSGEYMGVGPWGRYSVKLAYSGSIYTNNLTQLNVENPFCLTCTLPQGGGLPAGNYAPNNLKVGLPPSNQAHAFSASGATDVPLFKSRFTTTNQFSRWTQNAAFVDTSNNGLTADPLPASSLNGKVENFLTNNVLTSSLTDTLQNKVRVRYYEHMNRNPELMFGNVIFGDTEVVTPETNPPEYVSYKKTNINEDLTWNPWRWLTLGVGYGYEHWHRYNRFTTNTNEHVGSTFARVQLTDWAQWRVSYSFGARRYVGEYEIDDNAWLNSRMFDLANRDEHRARSSLNIMVTDAITVMPNGGLRWDDYPESTQLQTGVESEHSWNAGVDVSAVLSPTFRVMAGYNYEQAQLDMSAVVPDAGGAGGTGIGGCNFTFPGYAADFAPYTAPAICIWNDTLTQTFHTLVASADWKAIPDKLDFRVNYAASWSNEKHDFTPCSLNNNNCNGIVSGGGTTAAQVGLPWPNNKNLYQRLDVIARYFVDPNVVQMLGFYGNVVAKLRYTWARNDGMFWQSDALNAYFGTLTGTTELTGTSRSSWLAYNNSNFQTQMLVGSVEVTW